MTAMNLPGQLEMALPTPPGFRPDPRTMARREGPTTSRRAAEAAARVAGSHHDLIADVLRHRPAGLTVHEMAAYCSLSAHEIGKRMHEMQRLGRAELVLDNDGEPQTRAALGFRAARVWRLAGDAA